MEKEVKAQATAEVAKKEKAVKVIPEGFMTPAMIAEKYGKTQLAVRVKLRKSNFVKREDGWLISAEEAEMLFNQPEEPKAPKAKKEKKAKEAPAGESKFTPKTKEEKIAEKAASGEAITAEDLKG